MFNLLLNGNYWWTVVAFCMVVINVPTIQRKWPCVNPFQTFGNMLLPLHIFLQLLLLACTQHILFLVSLVPTIIHSIQNTFMKQVLLSVGYFLVPLSTSGRCWYTSDMLYSLFVWSDTDQLYPYHANMNQMCNSCHSHKNVSLNYYIHIIPALQNLQSQASEGKLA